VNLKSLVSKKNFKKEYQIDSNFILFVGRFSKSKGIETLIKAFNIIKNELKFSDICLVIMGVDFGYQNEMEELINKLNLSKNIIVIKNPPRDDVISAYGESEFLILPSQWELSPLVPLEAFAFKKPVISTNSHGIPYTVHDNKNGLLVEPENPVQLANAIAKLLNNSELREKLGLTGYNFVHEECNCVSMAKNSLKLYEKILKKKIFPLTLGGEHSITPGCIAPFAKKYKNLCLLHFDAHADLRESYNGEKFSHASAIRRCLDYKNVSVISFGIRNISKSEIPYLKKNSSRINIFWAKNKNKWNLNKFKKMIKNKTVYLTFDVDGLDSSIMPATGTPEPGGLFWDETLNIIKIAAKNSKIVGADINELSPIKGFNSYNFLVAKLAYKILSYKFLYK